nr:hypothetical protein [Tanacetum cinerariifolium]
MKTKKIDSSKKIETYNVYGFVWSLKIYIGDVHKQQILVKERSVSYPTWSSLVKDCTELLQPWLIRSMDYFRTLLVDWQPNGPIAASSQGIQPIICAAVVHDPQFEQQPKQVVESVLVFTSEELVAEYHSITTNVQLIENVGDEDSMAKQSVEKEIESFDGKSITNQFVQHPLESLKGERPETSNSDVFYGELSVVETRGGKTDGRGGHGHRAKRARAQTDAGSNEHSWDKWAT